MKHALIGQDYQEQVARLIGSAFTASEGEQEGALISQLASKLCAIIDNRDVICLGTSIDGSLVAVIFFTRLTFEQAIDVFMLAPVAVHTAHQGRGIGQALISYGLDELKKRSVCVAITYGDPSFYTKVGFRALPESVIQAPLELSMPFGWLGQSLTGKPIPVIRGRPVCVAEFNDPLYW